MKPTYLDELSLQEIYEVVRDHLLTQNARSLGKGNKCLYRGPRKLMCALGCLIPDDKYQKQMDTALIGDYESVIKTVFENPSKNLISLCGNLQMVHDYFTPEEWPKKLAQVATKHRLNP